MISRVPPHPPSTVEVAFGFSRVVACEGSTLRVTWEGYHNLVETDGAACDGGVIASPSSTYHNAGHVQFFQGLGAASGSTRYFKCASHCGDNGADNGPPSTDRPSHDLAVLQVSTAGWLCAIVSR